MGTSRLQLANGVKIENTCYWCSRFIGSHLSKKLIKDGNQVLGIDNFNTYYDVDLKYSRLNKFVNHRNFICKNIDLCDKSQLEEILKIIILIQW